MKRITKSLETLHLPRDKLLHTAYTPTKFKTEILPSEVINAVKKKPKPSEPNTVNCFTDGSKFNDEDGISRSGFGYLIWGENIRQNGSNYLGSYATVYQCELMAIQEAAFVMINKEVVNKKIIFYFTLTFIGISLNAQEGSKHTPWKLDGAIERIEKLRKGIN